MSFQDAISSVFHKYVCFTGRARRSEYWYWSLLSCIVSAILGSIYNISENSFIGLLSTVWALGTFLPSLGVFWRRMHDIGKSGAWYFLNFVPLVGQIILLVWLCKDSQPGINQYGPSPKYPAPGGYNPYGGAPNGGYNPYGYDPNNNHDQDPHW